MGSAVARDRGLLGLARRLGLGRLVYRTVHAPAGFLRRCRREGPVNLLLARRGRSRMEAAARRLPPVAPTPGAVEVHFLSGRAFWYQTAFCAFTLARHSPVPVRLVVLDDGSLDADCVAALRRIFPDTRFEALSAIEARLDRALPADRYPALRQRRLVYPHLRKLTDVHAGSSGWKLVLDSDMLFFREPAFLLGWLRAPDRPCHMLDVASAYGYPESLMAELAGRPVPARVNVGVCGLRGEEVDWDRLEAWCKGLLERAGSHYLQEQALTAMLLAGRDCAVAPEADYVALPSRREAKHPSAVMHHYVAESKAWYFRHGWRSALRRGATP
jgi:hypothetical protein